MIRKKEDQARELLLYLKILHPQSCTCSLGRIIVAAVASTAAQHRGLRFIVNTASVATELDKVAMKSVCRSGRATSAADSADVGTAIFLSKRSRLKHSI
jgi:hypothetical protein